MEGTTNSIETKVNTDNVNNAQNAPEEERTNMVRRVDDHLGPSFCRERLAAFQYQRHSLRLSASNIAALAGLHPWKNLGEMLLQHVYQGSIGQALLYHDASLLELEIVSEQQTLLALASKAGPSTKRALQEALQVKSGSKAVSSVEVARQVKQKVVTEAKKTGNLAASELKVLQEGARSAVDTGYGSFHEDGALDVYEKSCGWQVRERNAEIRSWPFRLDDTSSEQPTVVALGDAQVLIQHHHPYSNVPTDPTTTSSQEETSNTPFFSILGSVDGIRDELAPVQDDDANNRTSETLALKDDDSWYLRKVIVECKHRMNRIHTSIPLYEQVQAAVYCFMYEASEADIVQVMRTKGRRANEKDDEAAAKAPILQNEEDEVVTNNETINKQPENEADSNNDAEAENEVTSNNDNAAEEFQVSQKDSPKETMNDTQPESKENGDFAEEDGPTTKSGSDSKPSAQQAVPSEDSHESERKRSSRPDPNLILSISRVSLDDPILQHRQQWKQVILPRLRSFVDAVYAIRSNDHKRYQLLASSCDFTGKMEEAWQLLHNECPWLESCDTSYSRNKSTL